MVHIGHMKQTARRALRTKLRSWLFLDYAPRPVRRIIIGVVGGTILLIGLAMIVLPGPAIVVVPLGLAVLATEFLWARRWLKKVQQVALQARNKISPRAPNEPPQQKSESDGY